MSIPLGARVTVTVACAYGATSPLHQPPSTYTGTVVAHRAANPTQIALTTGLAHFPVRVLGLAKILTVNGVPTTATTSHRTSIQVQGSKNNTYTVSSQGCSCTGYTYRGTCKHHKEYLNGN